ncbi:MAG: hypothetical protein NT094_03995, partial [Candidatus Staskawiczbacteria bacterium]|nr:hypothetical protein [Candidatus Staskawiczbacteria bacterium]
SLLTYEVAAVIMGRPEIAGKSLFMGTPPIMCRDMKQRTLIFKNGRLKSRVIGYFSLISADEIIVFGKRRAQPEAVQN